MRRLLTTLLILIAGCGYSQCGSACNKVTGSCCKTCTNSKACGDSCIPSNQTCSKGAGCACNGASLLDEEF